MAGTLGKDFGEQFGRILRTGTFDELTGPLANLFSQSGLDPADIKSRFEGVEAGSEEFDALVADIQGNLRSGIDSSLLMLGDSLQFGGKQMGESFGLAQELIEDSAVIDPGGEVQQARARAIQNEIDSTMAAGDAQRDYAAATESFTRDMRVTADAMLDAMNPLTGKMDLLKGSMTALAVAVAAATLALGAMALGKGVSAIRTAGRGPGGRGPGGADDLLDDAADNTRRGSGRLGRFLKGTTRLLGKAALPLAVGMTAYDAYKGFTADPNASMSERFGNAGNSALSGLTFGLAGSDPDEIAARSTGEPATPDVPSARESRIAAEREDRNRRIQLAREGHSRSEIEAMMVSSREQSMADSESTATATPTPEVPSARPISELTTSEELSEERNRLDQLVQQNTITRQEQLDLLGELRDRERELSEAAYQARQFVGPPVPTATPAARAPEETPTEVADIITPTEVPTARTPNESDVAKAKLIAEQSGVAAAAAYLDNIGLGREQTVLEPRMGVEQSNTTTNTSIQTPSLATSTAPAVSGIRTPDQTVTSITPQAEASSREGFRTPPPPEAITASVPQTDINDIMMMLSYKLDTMISLLDTGVTIQDRILLESRS